MSETTKLYLCFENAEQSLAVARLLSGNPDVTELPPDGWYNGFHYDIFVIGTLYEGGEFDTAGNTISPPVALPGYHVNGWWGGPEDSVPEQLRPFMLFPATPRYDWR